MPQTVFFILNSLLYTVLGMVLFCTFFIIIDKLTPYDLWKELIEQKNQALATVVGFVGLGICVIIASAMH
ncbi:MAG: DUF350 domain-containing protein [Verrucomicrobia bacterium]|nr:DUF350 domain-containing protein [Verrucomicrobiota bacterium]